jgi:hypothetical protein
MICSIGSNRSNGSNPLISSDLVPLSLLRDTVRKSPSFPDALCGDLGETRAYMLFESSSEIARVRAAKLS